MKLNEAEVIKAQKQLSALVDYLIQSEDWKYIYLSEYAEPIRLFMFKTGMSIRTIRNNIGRALREKLGEIYDDTQHQLGLLAKKRDVLNGELIPHEEKSRIHHKARKRELRASNLGTTDRTPHSEFGRKYVEHFGYGSNKNKEQYKHEYYYYNKFGVCSWEVEGE